jgi:hypothetical protein
VQFDSSVFVEQKMKQDQNAQHPETDDSHDDSLCKEQHCLSDASSY